MSGSSSCIGTWKLGLRGQFEKVVCHLCETLKPKSVEQFRVSVKGDSHSSASLTKVRLEMEEAQGQCFMCKRRVGIPLWKSSI